MFKKPIVQINVKIFPYVINDIVFSLLYLKITSVVV